MIRHATLAFMLVAGLPAALAAQTYPVPDIENPRVQTVGWNGNDPIVLTALPETTLTVMLAPGEVIRRAVLNGDTSWAVNVSAESDSFQVKSGAGARPTVLQVETDSQIYQFRLEADTSLLAAYLVRVTFGESSAVPLSVLDDSLARGDAEPLDGLAYDYRLRGDRTVRPARIRDNGEKTVIEYAPEQPLPAVFAIGPTGKEQVVDGYMRGDRFVIDHVHNELVFRIDNEKATARRRTRVGEQR